MSWTVGDGRYQSPFEASQLRAKSPSLGSKGSVDAKVAELPGLVLEIMNNTREVASQLGLYPKSNELLRSFAQRLNRSRKKDAPVRPYVIGLSFLCSSDEPGPQNPNPHTPSAVQSMNVRATCKALDVIAEVGSGSLRPCSLQVCVG